MWHLSGFLWRWEWGDKSFGGFLSGLEFQEGGSERKIINFLGGNFYMIQEVFIESYISWKSDGVFNFKIFRSKIGVIASIEGVRIH